MRNFVVGSGRRKTEDGILSPQFPNLRFFYIDVGYRIYRICGYRRSTDVRARTSNFDGKGLRFEMFDVGKLERDNSIGNLKK